ncbi:hypothetical protein RHMOL_Rhmol01G0087600 [Rhododendron molle]|uniref:Uncharacterized protein n=1 Tax=Rhododendron molle TaxID=49168 RepID=A0ACC0Q1B9_RHOML|nr:hypothetical protein RHMOL_Rhmol01G0087600 [Rhododendron molle]
MEGKRVNDPFATAKTSNDDNGCSAAKPVCVPGPIIIGSGPSGLAAAACLKEKGVPSLILERENCIASLWQLKTYDRLRLHLPKQFCQLPLLPFPSDFPNYPTKQQFISYMEGYARHFELDPVFNRTVVSAEFDSGCRFWRVRTVGGGQPEAITEYLCLWVIVATGENAEEVLPKIEGMDEFEGSIVHTSGYKTGNCFLGKRVLVVGCGNSGMEVCLDLCTYDAQPSLVVRDSVHVLPQEMLGRSTFGLSMWLLKWLPVRMVDRFLLLMSRMMIGDTSRFGLTRPDIGPIELKNATGKTPVLDIGTLEQIKSGKIKETNFFSEKDGFPRKPFPHGWKGENGLYAVGFTKRGLLGTSMDATRIAQDIEQQWKSRPIGELLHSVEQRYKCVRNPSVHPHRN